MPTADENRGKFDRTNPNRNTAAPGGKAQPNTYEFSDLTDASQSPSQGDIEFVLDIPLEITIELGRTRMLVDDLLKLGQGSVIELPKPGGETLDVLANQRLIAKGEVVVVNEKYGLRLTEIVSPTERIERLR